MNKESIKQMLLFLEKGFECLEYLIPHKFESHSETGADGKKYFFIKETFDTDKLDESVPDDWRDDVDRINSAFHSEWGGSFSEEDGSVIINIDDSK